MPPTLRRLALWIPVTGALVLTVGMAPVPASAAAPLRPLAQPSRPAAAAVRTRTVAPLSSGYLEITTPDGVTDYLPGFVTDEGVDYNGIGVTLHTGLGPYAIGADAFEPTAPKAGRSYGLGTSNDGDASVSAAGLFCDDGDQTSGFEVDQLVLQPRQFDGLQAASVVALQFFCYVPLHSDAAGAGDYIYGAVAYNALPTTPAEGYYQYEADGLITGFGNDNYLVYLGDLSAVPLNLPIVGMATTPDDAGYWMVASDGGIFSFGDARFFGSMGGAHLNKPIVGIAPTPDGRGYWEVASDGGIFSFGDARFYGSMGGRSLNKPIVGIAAAPGGGYWEVASDGGIFAFGDAPFYGSTGNLRLNKPVVAMVPTADGRGYWFVASDGGIFNYGDARFHGSAGSLRLNEPIVGMDATPSGDGYWLAAADGGIFSFDAPFAGSLGGLGVTDVVGIVT